MAIEILVKQGTSKVWKASGGDYTFTPQSLANDAGRMGQKGDLGASFATRYEVSIQTKCGSAPTAGKVLEVYWAPSHDNSTLPGKVSGSDAAYPATVDDNKKQLLLIGCLVVHATSDAQIQTFVFAPPARYGAPVWVNKTGQTLTNVAADHVMTLTPLIDEAQ